jgi:hypothetical protein
MYKIISAPDTKIQRAESPKNVARDISDSNNSSRSSSIGEPNTDPIGHAGSFPGAKGFLESHIEATEKKQERQRRHSSTGIATRRPTPPPAPPNKKGKEPLTPEQMIASAAQYDKSRKNRPRSDSDELKLVAAFSARVENQIKKRGQTAQVGGAADLRFNPDIKGTVEAHFVD